MSDGPSLNISPPDEPSAEQPRARSGSLDNATNARTDATTLDSEAPSQSVATAQPTTVPEIPTNSRPVYAQARKSTGRQSIPRSQSQDSKVGKAVDNRSDLEDADPPPAGHKPYIRNKASYLDTLYEGSEGSSSSHINIFAKKPEPKSVELIIQNQFDEYFNSDNICIDKVPLPKETKVRFTDSRLGDLKEDQLAAEDRTQLYALRSFTEIQAMMNTKFSYKEGRLSSTLDIISQFMRGQKVLYLEAKAYCEFYLYRLMIPTIIISTACSVVGGIMSDSAIASMAVAAANGLNTVLLAIINYFKLDARAEAHRMTAYSFDQLISECEFTSGKILISNIVNDEALSEGAEQFTLKYVQDFVTRLEKQVKEIKQKNQFIIPDKVREMYQNIYYTNIFALVWQSQIQEMIITNQLKLACNALTEVENKIIKGFRTEEVYEDYNHKQRQKNELIEKILKHRQNLLAFDQIIRSEINKRHRRCKCFGFCF